jgi:hypothetical protein
MTSIRKTALVAGVLYLVTFITSIPAAFLQEPLLTNPNYVASAGADTQLSLSAVLDVITALAGIGTAVAVFSIVKREHEGLAVGFVTTRMVEAGLLAMGAVAILSVVSLRQAGAAAGNAESLVPVGQALVAIRDWTAVIGPGMASLNALMFGTLLYRSRLVPRAIPALGIVGAPVFIVFVIGTMLGFTGPGTAFHALAVFPFFFWELAVGLWMTFKGFNPSAPILAESAEDTSRSGGAQTARASRSAFARAGEA